MWFEILPSFGIIVGAMSLPYAATYYLHKLALGNAYKRDLRKTYERLGYSRDMRLTNNPYKVNGLESIRD